MKSQLRKGLLGFALIASLCTLPACGGFGGGGGGDGYNNILSSGTLTSISPSSVTAGGPPFTLTINGTAIQPDVSLVWNGGPSIIPATISSTQVTVVIDASLIANPGSISIVLNLTAPATSPSNALTLTVSPRTSTACALFGVSHFLFTGFDSRGPATVVGAFGVDASGNVSGEEDFLDPAGTEGGPILGGQCTNSATPNQGTLTITLPRGGANETFTYTFVLQQGGGGALRGQLVESGDVTGVSGTGLFVGVPPDQSLSGDYAFGLVGMDETGGRMSEVGRFTDSNGIVSGGVADVNDAGTVTASAAVTGSILVPDIYSRVVATLTIGGQYHAFDIFVNSSEGGYVIDRTGGNGIGALAGFISSQANAGAYNNGDLDAPFIYSIWGATPGPPASSDTTIGLASGFNSGAGTFNLQFDNVAAGVSNLNQVVSGATYSIASNGRTTVSYSVGRNTVDYVYYLDDSNDGFILGESGNTVEFGYFQPQAPGPFSTATINGTFASATFLPMTPASPNLATEITLNNGSISANTPAGALTGTYTVAASGRGTANVNLPVLGGSDLVFYVIGPDSVEVMGSDNTMSDAIAFMHL